ncbi:MAG TPA: ABC transporter substrate-binding protein [Luteolibacter sp.]|nr:ABC transporter substrate-binding protein [Luteolibacter sp.]
MRSVITTLAILATGFCLVGTTGCRKETTEVRRTFDFEGFIPIYNRHITKFVTEQLEATKKEIVKNNTELATAEGEAKARLEIHAEALKREQEKWEFRLSLGDYLKKGDPSQIPTDLVWQNGLGQPEIGDPKAKKGGVLRRHFPGLDFPPTIRPFGPNANNGFRSDLYDNIEIPLVALHPATMKEIPGVATEWAITPDGRTVYMKLDPAATYSDGVPVKARDLQVSLYVRCSDNVVNPFTKEYFRDTYAQIAVYDDHLLSVSLPEPTVYPAATAGAVPPSPPHFYAEYGPDYAEKYQWRFPPTTGAYEVKTGDVVKGVSITQSRVKDWWAKNRKYYKYRFNPDKMVTTLVRDESKAFELFRAGELDSFFIAQPDMWYEKSEIQPIYDGYIEKAVFYNRYPRIPRGMYLNVTKPPLNDRNVRIGIQHAMNWQKIIDVMFRGDYTRLNSFQEGMGIFSDASIRARPYSVEAARAAFREAGYTNEAADGILTKPDGTRLSVSVSYTAMPLLDRIFAILREDARACGFELRLDGLESTVSYKKVMQKQHEISFSAWNASPPMPEYYQFLHSQQAFDEKGNPKPQTNNLFVWGRPDTDIMVDKARYARDEEELRAASWALQKMVHDEAIFVPSYKVPFNRIEYWRYVQWPDSEETKFSPAAVYEPHEGYCFWIDEDIQKETLEARREGRTFPEVNRVIDAYRDEPAPQAPPVPAP